MALRILLWENAEALSHVRARQRHRSRIRLVHLYLQLIVWPTSHETPSLVFYIFELAPLSHNTTPVHPNHSNSCFPFSPQPDRQNDSQER